MKPCPKCHGSKKAKSGRNCPACQGTGEVTPQRFNELVLMLKALCVANQNRASMWSAT